MTDARARSGFVGFASITVALALLVTACASSSAVAPAPAMYSPTIAPREAAPRNDLGGGAASELDQAEADLNRALGGRSGVDKKMRKEKDAPSKSADAPTTTSRPGAADDADGAADGGSCANACAALGSMDRAAARLCELTGEGDPGCLAAHDRVSRARDRVMASCGACTGP